LDDSLCHLAFRAVLARNAGESMADLAYAAIWMIEATPEADRNIADISMLARVFAARVVERERQGRFLLPSNKQQLN
jgi:hypothetical protein